MLLTTALLAIAAPACQAAYTAERFALMPSTPAATVLSAASHVATLTSKVPRRAHVQAWTQALINQGGGSSHLGRLTGGEYEYTIEVTIGGQDFTVIIDTGSSDLWVPDKGFQCLNLTGAPVSQSSCGFSTAPYDVTKSATLKPYPNHNLNITYGSGEFVTGPMGFDTVTVAGLTVEHQEFSRVTRAAYLGEGVNMGIIGLAHPDLTYVYNTSDPSKDSPATFAPYDPFFFSAVKQNKVAPYFSVALNRQSLTTPPNGTSDLGYLAFGGLPPVKTTGKTATVQAQAYAISATLSQYLWWTVPVDAFVFPGSAAVPTNGTAILDTGTATNKLPAAIADALNAVFDPPAVYDAAYDAYIVSCNATAPAFSVTLGGVAFAMDPRDMILSLGITDADGTEICVSSTQSSGANLHGLFILGDVFLNNVVATFQTAANVVTLTERTKY